MTEKPETPETPKTPKTPETWCVAVPIMPVHAAPARDAEQVTQGLLGEPVQVVDEADADFVRLRLLTDGYEGYGRKAHIAPARGDPTHKVIVPATLLFPKPDLKSVPARPIYAGSRLVVRGHEQRYLEVLLPDETSGWVVREHVAPVNDDVPDAAAFALRLLHAPYLWGGRSVRGIDCSGLVQLALALAGHAGVPRDSGDQMRQVGKPLPLDLLQEGGLQKGDLVFWKGHVGMMLDAETLIHANAHHMMVATEPIREAVRRIADQGSAVLAIRRP
ncbi:NlpC/P60 family protein [Thermopetrobacter sp. TC1]|uniref:C40 family peptidase n=1 Tax=Thermopetrobacter sp. TC1 TaxID=1495045 RepID=UPI00068DCCB8|nr:NlpC/P60 family protein [Thermopetrobacter sp. TC1]